MAKYILNNQIVECELPEQGYRISTDITEKNVHVSLTDEQLAFYEANPTASIMEVWNCALNPVVATISIPPEVIFDSQKALDELYVVFQEEYFTMWQSNNIITLTEKKYFFALYEFLEFMLSENIIDIEYYGRIYNVFLNQNIDLATSKPTA